MLENLLLVENLNRDALSGVDVPSELDLREVSLSDRLPEVVPPDASPASSAGAIAGAMARARAWSRAWPHFPLLLRLPTPLSLSVATSLFSLAKTSNLFPSP